MIENSKLKSRQPTYGALDNNSTDNSKLDRNAQREEISLRPPDFSHSFSSKSKSSSLHKNQNQIQKATNTLHTPDFRNRTINKNTNNRLSTASLLSEKSNVQFGSQEYIQDLLSTKSDYLNIRRSSIVNSDRKASVIRDSSENLPKIEGDKLRYFLCG